MKHLFRLRHRKPNANICNSCGHDESACSPNETYRRAKELIGFKGYASAGLLQRDLKISYEKAAVILAKLEDEEMIVPSDGAKPRAVNFDKLGRK